MRRAALICVFVLACVSAAAAEEGRYIVVLQPGRELADVDVQQLGGAVVDRSAGQVVVTLPVSAAERLLMHASVRYMQRSVGIDELRQEQALLAAAHVPVENAITAWSSGKYEYDGVGNIYAIGTPASPGAGGVRHVYEYDPLSRIKSMSQIGSSTISQSYGYDVYGNLTQLGSRTIAVVSATNRLVESSVVGYDALGNLIRGEGGHTYRYDALNMMMETTEGGSSTGERYLYTASDERVGVLRNGTSWTWSLRGADGKVLRQYQSPAASSETDWLWLEDFVYRDGALLATKRPAAEGGTRHFHTDHLGTARVVTGETGAIVTRHDYYPFGVELTPMNQSVALGFSREEPMRFTSHERDLHGGTASANSNYLDYMHARYYDPTAGRFLSVDPDQWYTKQNGTDEEKREFQINLRRPQGWNRYSYAYNNPIRYTDPDGKVVLVDDAAVGLFILGAIAVTATHTYLQSPNASDPSRTNAEVMGSQIKTAVTGVIGTLTSLAQNNRHNQEVAASQLAAAAKELGKVSSAGGPGKDPDFNHHKGEIKAMLDRALRVAKRLPKKAYEEVLRQAREIGSEVGLKY